MTEEQIEWLKDNITLEIKQDEYYNGGMMDGSMYTKYKEIQLKIDGVVISSVSFE